MFDSSPDCCTGQSKGRYCACARSIPVVFIGVDDQKIVLPVYDSATEGFETAQAYWCSFRNDLAHIVILKMWAAFKYLACNTAEKNVKPLLFKQPDLYLYCFSDDKCVWTHYVPC